MSRSELTPLEHTGIGALAGCTEVMITQPAVALKNAAQEGRKMPTGLMALYRGLGMNMASMAPITATQFGVQRFVQGAWEKASPGADTNTVRLGSAFVGGGASALCATPCEMIVIHQQKSGKGVMAVLSAFFSQHGSQGLMRGLLPCILREAPYTAGYLGLFPVIQESLLKAPAFASVGPFWTTVGAGMMGGTFGAVASQPFDTIKTCMQANMYSDPKFLTMRSTVSALYNEGGLRRFWAGGLPRAIRINIATFILNSVRTNVIAYVEEQRR